ncbi:hypothetical protein HS088_TW10G00786 [Tripterygium wilfordii]|uniref:Phospholipase-like protein n=1 Tax=Tripterygium wilfordii TaxID=458696 RepID=A0A7J7D5Z5_TRIWF|nr:uncharacterized protein LOC120006838 [Tripterygium wilfordii]KAF5741780.1 hypothetical protein HS088_TW10G00786 [Tripterygium wilfordii]
MAGSELEQQLMDAANRLVQPSTSIDELLSLLDRSGESLSKMDQSSGSIMIALLRLKNALVCDKLLRHSNMDVKVLVANCLMELMRITAPHAPYDDERLKEVFYLIVAAFDELSQMGNRYFAKAVSTLEVFAVSKVVMVMLDLECDELIVKLFQFFLTTIRPDYPKAVFFNMETIMTDAIMESNDISVELLNPFLDSVKKESQNVSPTSWMLGKNVIENCATKLEPYLVKAVESEGMSLDSYDHILGYKCQSITGNVRPSYDHGSQKPMGKSTDVLSPGSSPRRSMRKKPVLPKVVSCQSTKLQHSSRRRLENKIIEISPNEPTIPAENQVSSSKMVIVYGYEVKASSAPILKAIFAKYGDITSNCLYRSVSMRASLLEIVCGVVSRLQSTDIPLKVSELKVIQNEVRDLEAAKIEVSWLSQYLEKMTKVEKIAQMKTTLKSIKANSVLVIKSATKDLEEALMELVAVQKRMVHAEKCVSAMRLVTRKINDAIKEAENEQLICQKQMDVLL